MPAKNRMIELNFATADTSQDRAAAQGLSVSELVAGMTALSGAPASLSDADLADLDHEWAAIKAGDATVAHKDFARCLQSWGTPAFKSWHDQ